MQMYGDSNPRQVLIVIIVLNRRVLNTCVAFWAKGVIISGFMDCQFSYHFQSGYLQDPVELTAFLNSSCMQGEYEVMESQKKIGYKKYFILFMKCVGIMFCKLMYLFETFRSLRGYFTTVNCYLSSNSNCRINMQ